MIGRIFDIQRFSVHDGPGIRTTVFMKGCPLRCKWCHNPEGLSCTPELQFFEDECIGCGACGDRTKLSDALHCPSGALKIAGREVCAEEIMREALRDRVFYSDNGGITISGGECLVQADFVAELLSLAKREGLHTAIDTSGCVLWSEIEKTVDLCDLYLYDVKCLNPRLHKEYTGVDNFLILENLKKLSALGKEIWVRIPVIPGFNNDEGKMTEIAEFISSLFSVRQVTLMPYHTLGASKYKTLGLKYPYDTNLRISENELERFKEIFRERGLLIV